MFITKVLRRMRKASTKQVIVASAFMVALAGAVGLGLATRQTIKAASFTRDCSHNAIDNQDLNGGCGFADASEFIADVRNNNPSDLQAIYASYGLNSTDYDRFVKEAVPGIAYKDGTIQVDGRVVATDAWSIGRDKKANSWNVDGYWADSAQNVFLGNEIPVMVLFDSKGVMQFAVMNPCGNATTGNKVVPTYACKSLTKSPVEGEKDTYMFTTDAPTSNGATVAKVVYDFGDGTTQTVNDLSPVKHHFAKPGNYDVKVSVTFSLPGNNTQTVEGLKCHTAVTVLAPYYACTQLIASSLNADNTQFRFTVMTKQGNGATLKDADFTLDGGNTTTGVTTKDKDGNIYKEYTFAADGSGHTVVAKVNFNVADGVQSVTCKASVTSTKAPTCTVPGKENLPPNSPQCVEECKPGIPVGDSRCATPVAAQLPNTGAGDVFGLFAGTSAFGAVAHRVFKSRRQRRS